MKAQVSPEFLMVYAVLLTIALILFVVYFNGNINLFQNQDKAVALRNANSIAAAINYVYLAGNGASYRFTVSGTTTNENITLNDYSVSSTRTHGSASAPLLDANVNETYLERGEIRITNNRGDIHIDK